MSFHSLSRPGIKHLLPLLTAVFLLVGAAMLMLTPTASAGAVFAGRGFDASLTASLTSTPTPTCCNGVTGTITSYCNTSAYPYHYTFALTNSCPITATGSGSLAFQVSPNSTGPWTSPLHVDYFNYAVPPGYTESGGAMWSGPLPAGNYWWRYRLSLSGSCWFVNIASEPQPACVGGTVTVTPVTATPTVTPTCQPAWGIVSSPNATQRYNSLYGVAAASSRDVWAVGYSYTENGPTQTLIMHWNGSEWTIVPSPAPGISSQLHEVTAVSSDDVWAVGTYTQSGQANTLTLHWNGSEWSHVASPNVGSLSNVLYGVSAVSSSDVWAVGTYSNGGYTGQTLTMRWNGSAWSVVPSPNGPLDSNSLRSVWAYSPGDVWAVGEYHPSGGGASYTLTMRWNGTQWSIVPSPNPGSASSMLNGVSGSSSNDVWAVGISAPNGGPIVTLIEHWDGQAWSVVPSPNVGTGTNSLNAVAVATPSEVWAVGFYITTGFQGPSRTLALRWDGQEWHVSSTLNPGTPTNILNSVSAASVGDVWAVGGYQNDPSTQTLVEHYGCGSITPTPGIVTPTATPSNVATSTPPGPSHTTVATVTVSVTATTCSVQFIDVPSSHVFYPFVRCLACRGIVSGYADGTFRPDNQVTRGQLAKIVSNAAGYNEPIPPDRQTFEDVPPSHPFWLWIERMAIPRGGVIGYGGYSCGSPGEPCGIGNRPYFRPYNQATRAQLVKIVVLASRIPLYSGSQQPFSDVPTNHPFYQYIITAWRDNIITGYNDGTFRPYNNVTRGQSAKIVANAFFPGCQTP